MIETGVYFGDIHSFHDLNLILSSVEIAPASPKTNYVDIPGADGALDLTESHGEVKYSDRTHKFTLTMNPADDLSEAAWEAKKTEVSNRLNGRACRITLDKDPDYYWQGRCAVDSYKSNKRLRQFVISARVRPYKYKQTETVATFTPEQTTEDVQLTLREKKLISAQTGNVIDTSDKDYQVTEAVDVSDCASVIISGWAYGGYYAYAFYNSDGSFLDGLKITDSYSVSTGIDKKTVPVPTGASTLVIATYTYKMTPALTKVYASGAKITVSILNGRKSVCPIITFTHDNNEIVFNGNVFRFNAGQHQNLNIRFTEGINQVTISSTGQVTFTYQEGDL